jgi:hypothetical protein
MDDEFKLSLRCHICGKPITESRFVLTSQARGPIDKVFALHEGECVDQISDQPVLLVFSEFRAPTPPEAKCDHEWNDPMGGSPKCRKCGRFDL